MGFRIDKILHASVIVSDTARALAFYRDVLGLSLVTSRPELGFAGAWLQVGCDQIHLLEVPNPDPTSGRPEHGGRDRHIALAIDDVSELQRRLDQAAIPYTLSRSGRRALFVRDPDGNTLELVEQS